MITCEITRSNNKIIKFVVSGHAYQDELGSDIVCAGVSAIVYTALGALEELAECSEYEDIRETPEGATSKDEYIAFELPKDVDPLSKRYETAQIILESMVIGFKQIKFIYDEYVNVFEEEV